MGVIDNRVVNIDELALEHFDKGDKFGCDYVRIAPMLGAICEYPDSKKVGAFAKGMRHTTRHEHHVDYWTDEI